MIDLKIISEIENPVFNRREIEGEIYADSTPSRQEVVKIISEKFSVQPEVIKIKTIKGKFGQKVFLIVVNIYKSKEDRDKIELKKKKDLELEKKDKKEENQEQGQTASKESENPSENAENIKSQGE